MQVRGWRGEGQGVRERGELDSHWIELNRMTVRQVSHIRDGYQYLIASRPSLSACLRISKQLKAKRNTTTTTTTTWGTATTTCCCKQPQALIDGTFSVAAAAKILKRLRQQMFMQMQRSIMLRVHCDRQCRQANSNWAAAAAAAATVPKCR